MSTDGTAAASTNARTLHQRIAAIAGEASVKVSGRTAPTAGARPALSIADVDRVLGDLMAEHGVTSDFEFLSEPTDRIETTANDKKLQTYRVHLRVYVTNADDPREFIAREVWDDGSNVSGAVSFALKRYLRALFHLAEDDDTQQTQQRQAQRSEFTPPREARLQQQGAGVSAAELADRSSLYDLAVKLDKEQAWVDTLLDTPQPDGGRVSKAALKTRMEKELAKRAQAAQEPAQEPEALADPQALVCPHCGSASAPTPFSGGTNGEMRCLLTDGGCGKTLLAEHRVPRAEWLEYQASQEAETRA